MIQIYVLRPQNQGRVEEKLRITSAGAVQITGADDQDNLVVKGGGTTFAVHQDDTDGEVSLRAQDGTGSNNPKYDLLLVSSRTNKKEFA